VVSGLLSRVNRVEMPKVSVVMNCLNGERYLREAIDSVVAQTYPHWEIVFWDNASTDASPEIAKSYGERIRYFRSPETYPLAKARKLALAEARREYVAFLDCDDIWQPRKLEKQIVLFEANPRVGLVFCDTEFFNEKGIIRQLYKRKREKPLRGMVFRELLRRYFLSTETVVIRSKALDDLGAGFDERLNIMHDKDLFLKIACHYELDYVDEPLAQWRVHGGSWSHSKYELSAAESELVLEKWLKTDPHFEETYAEEVATFRRNIVLQRALGEWKNNKPERARRVLRDHQGFDPKMLIAYVGTYLPSSTYLMARMFIHRFGVDAFRIW